ncbi:hypothetical protein ACGYLX_00390 [Sulfitobacter sp. 1A13496]|uniref:hypothetical protein n=1 Tax=Sulfitobacter sp. 1A13496 TaxID=3368596 RepID=UPI003747175F
MVKMISVVVGGLRLEPHWYEENARGLKPDCFGKRGGYRLHPSGDGHNKSVNSIFYKSLDDVAQHLRSNPDWGLRFKTSAGKSNIFYDGILVDGLPR